VRVPQHDCGFGSALVTSAGFPLEKRGWRGAARGLFNEAAMRVLRQLERAIGRWATVPIVALALCAAACSADEGDAAPSSGAQDAGTCESTSLDNPCSPSAGNETANDQELSRDELERQLDRIEQEIAAPGRR